MAARLSHPGIVTILDVGRNDKGGWLVQEFLTGRTLDARLEEGALPLREALRVGMDVARALAHAHANGVVHRDLTARNVFLCEDGQVKLLDLGMAQAFGRRKLEGGTPDYMAPEQARGAPEDERVDVFSLGVILYRMIAGESPFPPGARGRRASLPGSTPRSSPAWESSSGTCSRPTRWTARETRPRCWRSSTRSRSRCPRTGTGTRPGAVRVRKRWPRWAIAAAALVVLLAAAGAGALAARRWLAPPPDRLAAARLRRHRVLHRVQLGPGHLVRPRSPARGRVHAQRRDGRAGSRRGRRAGRPGRSPPTGASSWSPWARPRGATPSRSRSSSSCPRRPDGCAGRTSTPSPIPSVGTDTGEIVARGHAGGGRGTRQAAPVRVVRAGRAREECRHRYLGTLPGPVSGKWHTLRIEGSPSKGWYPGAPGRAPAGRGPRGVRPVRRPRRRSAPATAT